MEESGGTGFPWGTISETPHPLAQLWRRSRWRRHHLPNCNVPSPVLPHILTRQPPATHELHKMYLHKLKTTLEAGEIKGVKS